MIYNALTLPHFDYKLQEFENRAARIIAGLSYEIDSADVLETLGWETLESKRQRIKSVFLYKILKNYTAPNLKQSLVGGGGGSPMLSSYNLRNTKTDIALF